MRRTIFTAILLAAAAATTAKAQIPMPRLPVIFPLGGSQQQQPLPPGQAPLGNPGMLQGSLVSSAGSDTVYFSSRGSELDANAIANLTAQARWLLANPFASVRLEGHGDGRDSRDFALAIGEMRASEVRNFLVLRGVAPSRISVMSWGKERPGTVRIGPSTVAAGPRVVTIVTGAQPPMPQFSPPPVR